MHFVDILLLNSYEIVSFGSGILNSLSEQYTLVFVQLQGGSSGRKSKELWPVCVWWDKGNHCPCCLSCCVHNVYIKGQQVLLYNI